MIILTRDNSGKVVTVHILTVGGYAPIPINLQSYEIDWESIEYLPTRKSIKSAWDEWAQGKDIVYELRYRPELATPEPEPQPDWNALKFAFLTNTGYQRITLQTTAVIAVTRLETAVVDYIGGVQPTYSLFKTFWDAIINGLAIKPSQLEIDSWNAITAATNMKFYFSSNGELVTTE